MKLLREQRKLQSNNEELTFEGSRTTSIKKQRGRIGNTKRTNRLLCSRRQLNCEATPSSNVGVISSSHIEEMLICRFDIIHTPSCHVEGTTLTYQVGDIPSFASYFQGTSSSVQGTRYTQPYVDVQNVEGM